MIYYAKPNGKGDGHSLESGGNIEEMIELLNVGDTLYIDSGVYNYTHQITIHSKGTPENPITIQAYNLSDRPIFDFRMQPYGNRAD